MASSGSYGYARSKSGQYLLSRDGKEVISGTEDEVWTHLHKAHGFSVDHALTHEGYEITPKSQVPPPIHEETDHT